MELLAGAAAAAWSGGELFSYNRENYMFDKELLMKRDYQAQKMRVKKAELYREDVRDLVQLTVRKMDNYLVVSTLQLGFCMTLYVEGRPKPDIGLPHWLMHLFAMCNAGAFLYYLLSIWLSMHASVAAHAFGVRLLTQVVRLPIPDDATLDKSRFKAQQYEGNKVKEMFRVPVLQQQFQRLTQAMDKTDEEDQDRMSASGASVTNSDDEEDESNMMVVDLPHIRHFRRIQAHWQAYDAYARVCMAMGTNQLLHTLSYMMLGTLVAENDVPFPAFSCVVIFTACAWVLARLDLYLSRRILAVAGFLLVLPPAIVTLRFSLHRGFSKVPQPMTHLATAFYRCLVPLAFFLHILWIIFTLFVGRAKKRGSGIDMALPTTFRSVLFLDVFGWLAEESEQDLDEEPTFVLDEGGEEEEPIQRQLSRVSEGPEGAQEELPPEALQGAIVICRQLRARLAKDLERFESDDVQAMLSEDVREIRRLRWEFDQLCATFTEAEATLPASSSSGEVSQIQGQSEDSEPVWVRVDLESHGRMMQVFQNCEEGRCLCEEPPASGRILDILGLRAEIARFSEQIGTIRRQRRQRSRTRSRPTLNDAMDAPSMDLTFHPTSESAPQVFDPEEEEEERRRAERSRLTTTGRMPWRTVKLGSLVLIGAWAISLVWIIAYISFEAMHGHNTSTFDDTLTAGAMGNHGDALLQHFGHNQHKVTFALSTGELVNIQNWPTAFARPVGLACHRDFGALMALEKYAVHVLQEANGTAKDAHLLQDNIDRCIFGETDFQGQGIRSFSLHCEAVENCSLWLLAENGHQLLRCPLSPLGLAAEMMELKGGPWRAVQIQSHQELWASRQMGALDDERDQIVLLRRACHQQCDFLPRRDLDVPSSLNIDFLLRWPGVPWLFASSRKEELLRGFYLDSVEMPTAKFIELHQPPRRSPDERWLGGCVGNRSLYVLEDLGQSADQRLRIVRRSLDSLKKTSLSP